MGCGRAPRVIGGPGLLFAVYAVVSRHMAESCNPTCGVAAV
jgi:hypothetical protein